MLLLPMIVLSVVSAVANGCSCFREHPQKSLCRQDSFAMLVKIRSWTLVTIKESTTNANESEVLINSLSENKLNNSSTIEGTSLRIVPTAPTNEVVVRKGDTQTRPLYRRYRIKVYKAFKGVDINTKTREKYYIYTATSDSLCGVNLKEKKTYLVTGYISDGRLHFSLCHYLVDWKTTTKLEKHNMEQNLLNLESSCRTCQTTSCLLYNCKTEGINECVWNKKMQNKHRHTEMLNFMCSSTGKGRCEWNNTKPGNIARMQKQKRRRRSRERLRRRDAGMKNSKRASRHVFLP